MSSIKQVRRYDVGQIGQVEKTPQGFLKIPGFATRTGVFVYRDASGNVRRELRHPDDVMDPESLSTLKNAPVTLEHPPVMITPDNVTDYMKGYTTNRVDVNRDLIETDLIVAAEDAISAIEQEGVRELSAGYLADLDEEHGVYNGTEYDYRQKNIKYNHVALVRRGRAGPEARLRLDSMDAVMHHDVVVETPREEFTQEGENDMEPDQISKEKEGSQTKTVILSGRKLDMPDWAADIVQDMMDRYDQMRGEAAKLGEGADMKHDDKSGRKDVDISKPSPSPSVNVVQMAPDGREGSGKIGPADKMGASRAKGIKDEDEHGIVGGVKPNSHDEGAKALKDDDVPGDMKESQKLGKGIGDDDDDDDDSEKKDFEGAGGVGKAMSPVDLLKHELKEARDRIDAMQAKIDEYANQSMPGGEHKMDSEDTKTTVRKRVKLERQAEKVLPSATVDRFDSMSDDEIRSAVIKHRSPQADLKGKSSVYLESRFDTIMESLEGSEQVRREMGSLATRMDSEPSDPAAKRREMIQAARGLYQQNLSAVKK